MMWFLTRLSRSLIVAEPYQDSLGTRLRNVCDWYVFVTCLDDTQIPLVHQQGTGSLLLGTPDLFHLNKLALKIWLIVNWMNLDMPTGLKALIDKTLNDKSILYV